MQDPQSGPLRPRSALLRSGGSSVRHTLAGGRRGLPSRDRTRRAGRRSGNLRLEAARARQARRLQSPEEPRSAGADPRRSAPSDGAAGQSLGPRLRSLQAKLRENSDVLRMHLEAVQEISSVMARAIRDGESDGTYSAAHPLFRRQDDDQADPERSLDLHHHPGVELHGGLVEDARRDRFDRRRGA